MSASTSVCHHDPLDPVGLRHHLGGPGGQGRGVGQ